MDINSVHRDNAGNPGVALRMLTPVNLSCGFELFIGNVPIGVQRVLTSHNTTAVVVV